MSSALEVHHELVPLQPVATELASTTRCTRCCLYKAMRIVDIAMLLFGVGVLVYSLWLEKKWEEGIADLPSGSSPPDLPRFVHACFGIGIAVCLSTIFGHVLANCISNCTLFLYIVIICCLLLLEVSVVIFTFFKMDWKAQITSYFGEERKGFQSFVMFHVYTCRIIILLIWVAQVNVVLLGAILCLLGIESTTHCEMEMEMDAPVFTQSFFVPESPPGSHNYPRRCSSIFLRPNRPPNLFLYFWVASDDLSMESQICTKANRGDFNGDSVFNNVVRAPDVPIFALMAACAKDPSPVKLNLGIGVYRTEDGKPHLLNAVRRAEQLLLDQVTATKEYLPITGSPEFNRLCAGLTFGAESSAIKERRVTTVQSVSASGSLRIGAEFLARHHHQRVVYLSVPTFANHPNYFRAVGIAVKTYRYYDPKSRELDFQGLLEDLDSAPRGAIVMLQACCHNPTGVDPTVEQWEQIRQLMRLKGLLPFFDSAYLGLASGSLDMDAQPVKMFVADGGECLVAQSFSKNMGLYGERVGALSIVCKTAEVASRVESQLTLVIKSMYLSPPIHGAAIAAMILNDRQIFDEWITELKVMAGRILDLRRELYAALRERGTPGDWRHIIRQVGLFTFSGLNAEQVAFMTKEYHIYMPSDGRINVAALSSKTVPRLADAIHAAVTCIA